MVKVMAGHSYAASRFHAVNVAAGQGRTDRGLTSPSCSVETRVAGDRNRLHAVAGKPRHDQRLQGVVILNNDHTRISPDAIEVSVHSNISLL